MLSDRTNVDFEMHSLSNFLTIDTGFHGSNKDDITGGKDRDFLDIEHVEVVQSVVSFTNRGTITKNPHCVHGHTASLDATKGFITWS